MHDSPLPVHGLVLTSANYSKTMCKRYTLRQMLWHIVCQPFAALLNKTARRQKGISDQVELKARRYPDNHALMRSDSGATSVPIANALVIVRYAA